MAYPVSLSEVKTHLRIDPSTNDDDAYISNIIIPTAVEYCNMYIDSDMLYTTDADCPYMVKQAMLITAADLYDCERTSYSLNNVKREAVIQRLLLPYKTISW